MGNNYRHINMTKRIISVIMVVLCLVINMPVSVSAASYVSTHNSSSTVYSNNMHDHVYSSVAKVANSYMCTCPDGTVARVENFGDVILIEKYNSKYKMTMQGTVKFELSKFGGFYAGANYFYLVFGQDNPEQKKDKEVVRIVRYTKNWQRVDSASLYDCNTSEIFSLCNTAFCEYNGLLYVRTGHKSYKDNNGFTHQAAMTICYDTVKGKILSNFNTVNNADWGSIENIGATYMEANAGKISFADHSLTNPYCVLLSNYKAGAVWNTMSYGVSFLANLGKRGALNTSIPEFTIGGVSSSAQQYIVVGASQPMDGSSYNMNVFVEVVPKNSFRYESVKISYLTGYAYGSTVSASNPYIVKINDNLFAILWEERIGYTDSGKVHYTYIDGNGNRLCDPASIDGCLSDCQPVLFGNDIVWYTTNGNSVKLYTIPASTKNTTNNNYSTNTNVNNNDFSLVYDYNYYMNNYPDIRVLYSNNPDGALQHFINQGMLEGRQASPYFNVTIYMNNYPDLKAVYGNNLPAYYQHFMKQGNAEGRNAMTRIR